MSTEILNGILCAHDIPVDDYGETNDNVLFLHNEILPLGTLIKEIADFKKIRFCYFVSDTKQSVADATENLIRRMAGSVSVDITSSGGPYSEVTPDLCWTHNNQFKVGGHDLNIELRNNVGKWILILVSKDI